MADKMKIIKIHNKYYDIANFNHPGGSYILNLVTKLDDATILWETYHALLNKDKITNIMSNLIVDDTDITNDESKQLINNIKFDFREYHELIELIKSDIKYHKADVRWVIVELVNLFIIILLIYRLIMQKSYLFESIILGTVVIQLLMNNLHNGSHFAISHHPMINIILGKVTGAICLWNFQIWMFHHVFSHHAYTGINHLDVDDYWLCDKNTTTILRIFVYPMAFVAHVSSYLKVFFYKQLWLINLSDISTMTIIEAMLTIIPILLLSQMQWDYLILFICSLNISYGVIIFPNHSLIECIHNNKYVGDNWLRLQVQNSANFSVNNSILSMFYGGMNLQIVHHLFPPVCHTHYQQMNKIIKSFCESKGIIYVEKINIIDCLISYIKTINWLKDISLLRNIK